jgi:hypothetical protein
MPENQEPKDKTDEKGNLPDPVMDVLKDLKDKVDSMSTPTEEPKTVPVDHWMGQREADRKALGFTEEQMRAHERAIARAQAPTVERTAWSALEKKPDFETLKKDIEKEASLYPIERRTPEIMEKIYYMVRGQKADSKPVVKDTMKPNSVERSRITGGPGYTGNEPGMGGAGEKDEAEKDEVLDDREKFVASKLGITEKEYAKSRNVGREIRDLRVPDARPVNSLADVELKRLTGKR